MKKDKFMYLIGGMIFIVSMLASFGLSYNQQPETKIVLCEDSKGNKIIGSECIEEIPIKGLTVFMLMAIFGALLIIGAFWIDLMR